jgi:hypothetical protein
MQLKKLLRNKCFHSRYKHIQPQCCHAGFDDADLDDSFWAAVDQLVEGAQQRGGVGSSTAAAAAAASAAAALGSRGPEIQNR